MFLIFSNFSSINSKFKVNLSIKDYCINPKTTDDFLETRQMKKMLGG